MNMVLENIGLLEPFICVPQSVSDIKMNFLTFNIILAIDLWTI